MSGKISKVLVTKTPNYELTLTRTEINQNKQCGVFVVDFSVLSKKIELVTLK